MARDKFEDLRSVRERPQDDYLPNLQEMFSSGGALPPPAIRIKDLRPQDPSRDTFEERWRGRPAPNRSYSVEPGYQERFYDPSKVISEGGKIPPSLNVPMKRVAAPTAPAAPAAPPGMVPIPEGFTLVSEG